MLKMETVKDNEEETSNNQWEIQMKLRREVAQGIKYLGEIIS